MKRPGGLVEVYDYEGRRLVSQADAVALLAAVRAPLPVFLAVELAQRSGAKIRTIQLPFPRSKLAIWIAPSSRRSVQLLLKSAGFRAGRGRGAAWSWFDASA